MRRRLAAAVLLVLVGCTQQPAPGPAPDRLVLTPATFDDLPGWRDDSAAAVLPALLRSCERIARLPFDRSIGAEGIGGVASDWSGPCGAARRLPAGDNAAARAFFQEWFAPWAAANEAKGDGLFTGYFEPELKGATRRQPGFAVPLLGRPADLVTVDLGRLRPDIGHEQLAGRVVDGRLEAYPSRAEIEAGALGELARPLFWLDDPVDAHILHIQGSGRIRLEDGRTIRVGVAATNGRKFVGIGKVLADEHRLDAGSSMPAIRDWLHAHPNEAPALLAANPRYVFYRIVEGDGPLGAEGVALTPERSLAIDARFIPLGVPLWLDTAAPSGNPIRRLVMAQDTGAAIKGPVRGDLFWGAGEASFQQAGRMKAAGRYWLLLPRNRSPRLAAE